MGTFLRHSVLLLLYSFDGLFSRTAWVSRHQKGKPFAILLEQEIMGWQWHQLDHMQVICTSLHTDNHASTSPLSGVYIYAVSQKKDTTQPPTIISTSVVRFQ